MLSQLCAFFSWGIPRFRVQSLASHRKVAEQAFAGGPSCSVMADATEASVLLTLVSTLFLWRLALGSGLAKFGLARLWVWAVWRGRMDYLGWR